MSSGGSESLARGAEALAGLFEEYYDRIARYIAVRVGNRDDAEELASEVFLRAVKRLDTFQWRGIPLQAWLFRIAHNLAVDHLRKYAKRRADVPVEAAYELRDASDTQQEVELKLSMEAVYGAMKNLSAAQQEVIALRFSGGLSSAEVAQLMGRTNGAVRELQRTALKALRHHLGVQKGAEGEVTG